jgi:hypothetical protein
MSEGATTAPTGTEPPIASSSSSPEGVNAAPAPAPAEDGLPESHDSSSASAAVVVSGNDEQKTTTTDTTTTFASVIAQNVIPKQEDIEEEAELAPTAPTTATTTATATDDIKIPTASMDEASAEYHNNVNSNNTNVMAAPVATSGETGSADGAPGGASASASTVENDNKAIKDIDDDTPKTFPQVVSV